MTEATEDVILPEQRRYIVTEKGEKGGVQHRSVYEPLNHYLASRQITERQHRAGSKLFVLWRSSAFGEQYVTMRFGDAEQISNAHDRALVAREYFEACAAISGDFERQTTLRVCCGGDFAGRRRRFTALVSGLDDLVRHFGM